MNPIRRRPCADPGQKQVPGEWMTQKGIDSSRPVTEASRAKLNKAHERSHHRYTGIDPAFPAQWFYGLLRALPGDQACLTPSPALLLADLTPASGRQNDTTWPYASASFVRLAIAGLTLPRQPYSALILLRFLGFSAKPPGSRGPGKSYCVIIFRRLCLAAFAPQQGHRGKVLMIALIKGTRMVAIEFGMWRSGRNGGSPWSIAFGKDRRREDRSGTRS